MSDPPTRRAPPGWYSDEGQRGFRYWDGESWAEPMARPVGLPYAGDGNRSSSSRQRTGLAFLGAAVGLLVAGLLLPWADTGSSKRGVVDGDLPWLVGPGGVADTWFLILLAALMVWVLLAASLFGSSQRVWPTVFVVGLVVMGFCVAEGLALDNDLDLSGAEVGSGLFLAYAGGASSALSGILLRPAR